MNCKAMEIISKEIRSATFTINIAQCFKEKPARPALNGTVVFLLKNFSKTLFMMLDRRDVF